MAKKLDIMNVYLDSSKTINVRLKQSETFSVYVNKTKEYDVFIYIDLTHNYSLYGYTFEYGEAIYA
mgnify:CR=1 FL=1